MFKLITLTLASCLLLQIQTIGQDVIYLKNGEQLTGKILKREGHSFSFQPADQAAVRTLHKSEITNFWYDHKAYFSNTWAVEFYAGGGIVSPSGGIEQALTSAGFGGSVTTSGLFGNTTQNYPTSNNDATIGISLFLGLRPKSEIGLDFAFKGGGATGFRNTLGPATLGYRARHLTLSFRRYSNFHRTYWEIGIPLTFFRMEETNGKSSDKMSSSFQPGIKLGFGIVFPKKDLTGTHLFLTYHSTFSRMKIGDFQLDSTFYPPTTIKLFSTESFRYQALELGIRISLRFKKKR